ncbi:MAG TPA: hypothetical protein ENH80_11060 [Phycisphaerae bacterium]|nr:hypothetical protein [Phycisphaerae bacterium]HDZ44468.1 hypothetical protein [Phycisphaerae bacterium]
MMSVPDTDRQVLRDLAKQVAEAAADPSQDKKLAEWKRHNSLKPGRAMVLQAPEGVWDEFVPADSLQCQDDRCRGIEAALRTRLYKVDHLHDDEPIVTTLPTTIHTQVTGYGVAVKTTNPEAKGVHGAVHYDTVLEDDADVETLFQDRHVTVDWDASHREHEIVSDLVGDILDVRMVGYGGGWFSPMDLFMAWRGPDKMLLDLIDRPEWIHRAMNRLLEIETSVSKQMEALGVLGLNNGANHVGSGGIGTTDELPQPDFDGEHVRLKDLWGHAAAQIFSEVSPAMHDEFAIQYEAKFLSMFGLNCYGCCEPLHKKVPIVRKIPNIRRLSMSPWIEPVEGAEAIGGDMIFSFKPNPAYLSSGTFDLDICRREMIAVLDACKANGCVSEYIMKDTHICCGEPERYDQWTDMAMQLADEYA